MVDPYDPSEMLVCPYDPVHRLARKRMQGHLIKCRKGRVEQEILHDSTAYKSKGDTSIPKHDWKPPEAQESWDDDNVVYIPKKPEGLFESRDPSPKTTHPPSFTETKEPPPVVRMPHSSSSSESMVYQYSLGGDKGVSSGVKGVGRGRGRGTGRGKNVDVGAVPQFMRLGRGAGTHTVPSENQGLITKTSSYTTPQPRARNNIGLGRGLSYHITMNPGEMLNPDSSSVSSGIHSVPPGFHSVPSGTHSGPPGFHTVPSGTHSGPPGFHSVPSGTNSGPPGIHSVSSGTYSVPSGIHPGPPGFCSVPPGIRSGPIHSGLPGNPPGISSSTQHYPQYPVSGRLYPPHNGPRSSHYGPHPHHNGPHPSHYGPHPHHGGPHPSHYGPPPHHNGPYPSRPVEQDDNSTIASDEEAAEVQKKVRKLRKMLRQIEIIEQKESEGIKLETEQIAKLSRKQDVIDSLKAAEELYLELSIAN